MLAGAVAAQDPAPSRSSGGDSGTTDPARAIARANELVPGIAADGGAAAWAFLQQLDAALAAAGDRADRRLHLARYRLLLDLGFRREAVTLAGVPARDELFDAALAAARSSGDRRSVGVAHAMIADALAREGDLDAARDALAESLDQDLGPYRYVPLIQLANVEKAAGHLDRARELLDEAEPLVDAATKLEGERDTYFLTILLDVRGRVHLELGIPDLARRDFALAAALRPGGAEHPIAVLNEIDYCLGTEDFARAARLTERLLEDPPGQVARADLEVRLALARWRMHDDRAAGARLAAGPLAAATLTETKGERRSRMLLDLADLWVDAGDLGAARDAAAEAALLLGRIDATDAVDGRAQLAVVRVRLALRRGELDSTELATHRYELLTAAGELFARWRRLPVRPGGLGFLHWVPRRNVLSALVSVELALHPDASGAALQHLLDAQAHGTLARRLGLPAGSVADVQRELCPVDGGILVYLPALIGSHLFAITADAIRHFDLPPMAPTRAAVGELLTLLHTPPPDGAASRSVRLGELRRLAAEVRDVVLPPAAREVVRGWRSIAVVGQDLVAGLPLEVLPGEGADWLGLEQAIHYLPSLPVGLLLAERARAAPAAPRDLLVFAAIAPDGGPDRALVPLDEAELAPLWSPYAESRIVFGAGAQLGALSALDLESYAVLQVLGHGARHPGSRVDERPSALVCAAPAGAGADARLLRCADVEQLAGVPPLVLLAVCGAANAPPRRGDDEGMHLAGAFLFSGAVTVLAADGDLELRPALALLGRAHAELAAGAGPAEALRRARVALARDPRFADPYHHAVVRVLGLGSAVARVRPSRDTGPPRWLWVAALVGAVGGGVLVGWVRRVRRARASQPPAPGPSPEPIGGGGSMPM